MQMIPSLFPADFQIGVTYTKLLLEGTVTYWPGTWPIPLAFHSTTASFAAEIYIPAPTFSVETLLELGYGDTAPVGSIFILETAAQGYPITIVYSKIEFKP